MLQKGENMSNSNLVSYKKISPNRNSQREHKIDTITIHCYVGQASVEEMANWLCNPVAQASANYGIGADGRIVLLVDENDRSWCSSSPSNDHRAVTIECASDTTAPYAINDKVYKSLIDLCADICKRNDIKELKWKNDKSLIGQVDKQNMTVHRWFAPKACPGDYIFNRLGKIAEEVNKKLSGKPAQEIQYYVRRSWEDKKSQFNAYADLDIAKKNCPIGYTVYDKNGRALYTNKVPIGADTDNIWMGWTKRETGKDGLRNIHGDNGKAYGLQFDYRYGLVPFLQFCVNFNPDKYAPVKKFIALGAGNSALIYNKELGRLWQQMYDADPWEFEQLQYLCAYQNYYLPAKDYVLQHYGINIADKAPSVKGTLWSMAFRSGSETAAKKFAGCKGMSDIQLLNHVYPTYGVSDANRWTKAGQWGDALHALETGEYTTLILHMEKNPDKPQELPGNDFLSTLLKFQEQLQADIAAGRKWIYSNSGCSAKMSTAIKKGNRKCNCALLVRWALRKLGLLNGDNWWGERGGTIVWRGTSKEQMLKHFDLIHISGKKTVNQAIKDGTLQPGDIVTYVNMGHTNVYAGNGKWYDGGHAYCSGSGEGAAFKSWYGDTVHGSQPIGYILRRKGTEQPEEKLHIVREGSYIKKANANRRCIEINNAGIDCIVKRVGDMWWTQCGAFKELENAEERVRQLKNAGFDGIIKS